MATAASHHIPGIRTIGRIGVPLSGSVAKVGHIMYFFGRVIATAPFATRRYRREFVRILSDIAWGNGSIVVGGGTVGVAVVLGFTAGALIGVEGYNALNLLGLGPATGLIAAFGATRELAPIMVAIAFTTQAGCRFTAQLGAMRIAEEIDATDVLGIRSIPYLVTTRVAASAIAIIPLFLLCLGASYLACQLIVGISAGQSAGTYLHYFGMFVSARDIGFAMIKAFIFVGAASTLQCYYGYYAAGGPEGVGIAAGRAMRASITVIIVLNMLLTMALWGVDSGARFGG